MLLLYEVYEILAENNLNSNLNIDFSNADPSVQNINTLLQNLLNKFYPATMWLYNYGDECADITGGWSNSGYSSTYTSQITQMTKNESNIFYQGSPGVINLIGVNKAIDLTNFSTLHVKVKPIGAYNNQSSVIVVLNSKVVSDDSAVKFQQINSLVEQTYSIDISDIEGGKYIVIYSQMASECKGYIYQVWLE